MIFVILWLFCGAISLAIMFGMAGKDAIDTLVEQRIPDKKELFYLITVVLGPITWLVWLTNDD